MALAITSPPQNTKCAQASLCYLTTLLHSPVTCCPILFREQMPFTTLFNYITLFAKRCKIRLNRQINAPSAGANPKPLRDFLTDKERETL